MPSAKCWGSNTATARPRGGGLERGGEVVWSGAGGDDGSGCVEDRVDDAVQAFTGAGWADQQDRVFPPMPTRRCHG